MILNRFFVDEKLKCINVFVFPYVWTKGESESRAGKAGWKMREMKGRMMRRRRWRVGGVSVAADQMIHDK